MTPDLPPPSWPLGNPETIAKNRVILNGKWNPNPCAVIECDNDSGFLESPFCDDCIWKLWAHIDSTQPEHKKALARQGRIDEIHRWEAERTKQNKSAQAKRSHANTTEPGTIYYLRVGDLIKIGFTTDIEQRLRQYPPNVELLAQHPGTKQTETRMHHKFLNQIANGREWFTPCKEISQHISEVRKRYAQKTPLEAP